jgi:choline dehydrogenase
MLEHPDDIDAMLDGIHQGLSLLQHPLLAGRYALPEGMIDAPDTWRDVLRQGFGTYNHGVGTCRLGEDDTAVVGTDLGVHGVAGLTVADASVLPVLPHANTNFSVALVAEWAAEHLAST